MCVVSCIPLNSSIMLDITMSISQIRKLRLRAIAQSPTSKSVRAKIQI